MSTLAISEPTILNCGECGDGTYDVHPSAVIPSAVCGAPVRQAFPTTTEYVTCTRYGHVTQAPAKHRA